MADGYLDAAQAWQQEAASDCSRAAEPDSQDLGHPGHQQDAQKRFEKHFNILKKNIKGKIRSLWKFPTVFMSHSKSEEDAANFQVPGVLKVLIGSWPPGLLRTWAGRLSSARGVEGGEGVPAEAWPRGAGAGSLAGQGHPEGRIRGRSLAGWSKELRGLSAEVARGWKRIPGAAR